MFVPPKLSTLPAAAFRELKVLAIPVQQKAGAARYGHRRVGTDAIGGPADDCAALDVERGVAAVRGALQEQRASAPLVKAQASDIKRSVNCKVASSGIRARVNLGRHPVARAHHLDIRVCRRAGRRRRTPEAIAIDVKGADTRQARTVLANSGRPRQQDNLAAGIVRPPAFQVEARGCTGAITIDGQGRVGIAASRAVTNLERRALGNRVRGVARLALDLERPCVDIGGAAEGAGAAEREVSGARLVETLGTGHHRADDIGCALDRDAGRPAARRPSVSGPPVPVLSVQLCLVAGFKSSNTIVPMVRAPSSVTVVLAFKLRVLKSATASVPPAMSPPLQLLPVAQEPPAGLAQTPEPAGALMTRKAGALVTPLAVTV